MFKWLFNRNNPPIQADYPFRKELDGIRGNSVSAAQTRQQQQARQEQATQSAAASIQEECITGVAAIIGSSHNLQTIENSIRAFVARNPRDTHADVTQLVHDIIKQSPYNDRIWAATSHMSYNDVVYHGAYRALKGHFAAKGLDVVSGPSPYSYTTSSESGSGNTDERSVAATRRGIMVKLK